ncbi:MAG: UDP-N-acetylmuramoyl-L-alanine--D-glutamate ligase, partial [Elusimicrobia bacterium]|nr:UDP-N-acetylmuramoyl-L-alanine--D-glutamate ligase [Elusimicrobiota bacterium]
MTKWDSLLGHSLRRTLARSSVAVLGLGRSGLSAARLLLDAGAKVFGSELEKKNCPKTLLKRKNFLAELGSHTKKILRQDLIVVSPGVPWDLPVLQAARKKRIPVWSEIEFGFRLAAIPNRIAITGTNGKTTTVSLTGDICKRSGRKTFVGGNIGNPLCDLAIRKRPCQTAVLEISSYQLEGISKFHAQVSVVLNVTPDHLKRHKTMSRYAQAKERIFLNQTSNDFTILNWDDSWCRKMAAKSCGKVIWISTRSPLQTGVWWDPAENRILARLKKSQPVAFRPPRHLPGLHNIENSCAAIAAALSLGIGKRAIQESLDRFPGVEHRLEKVRTVNGVTYVNDSKATNVDSTLKAIVSFRAPLWLLLGGEDKGSSYKPIRELILSANIPVKGIFLIGEAATKIRSDLGRVCDLYDSRTLSRAVKES